MLGLTNFKNLLLKIIFLKFCEIFYRHFISCRIRFLRAMSSSFSDRRFSWCVCENKANSNKRFTYDFTILVCVFLYILILVFKLFFSFWWQWKTTSLMVDNTKLGNFSGNGNQMAIALNFGKMVKVFFHTAQRGIEPIFCSFCI